MFAQAKMFDDILLSFKNPSPTCISMSLFDDILLSFKNPSPTCISMSLSVFFNINIIFRCLRPRSHGTGGRLYKTLIHLLITVL